MTDRANFTLFNIRMLLFIAKVAPEAIAEEVAASHSYTRFSSPKDLDDTEDTQYVLRKYFNEFWCSCFIYLMLFGQKWLVTLLAHLAF